MQVSAGILREDTTLRTNLPVLHKSMESDAGAGSAFTAFSERQTYACFVPVSFIRVGLDFNVQ